MAATGSGERSVSSRRERSAVTSAETVAAARASNKAPWLVGILCFALAAVAAAEEPPIQVNPNRPTFATPALTTQVGAAELELGLQHSLARDAGSLSASPFLLKLGLLKRVELRIGGNGALLERQPDAPAVTGFGDLSVGGQWCYLPAGPLGVDQAVQVAWKVPTASASKGLGSGEPDRTLMVLLSRDVGAFHADGNLLATWLGRPAADGRGTAFQPAATLSVSRTLDDRWSATGELYWIGPTSENPRVVSNLWAIGCKLAPSLVLDAALDVGLSHGGQKISFLGGLTVGVGRFRRLPDHLRTVESCSD